MRAFSRFMLSPFASTRFMRPMPGRTPPAAGGGGLTTLSFQADATSTSDTITGPASIAAGDLLVLWDGAHNLSGLPTSVVPTGFTSIVSFNDGSNDRAIASYKIADGSEASATITGMNGNISDDKMLYVFRGNQAISSVSALDIASESTAGNPTAQVVNASGGTPPLIVFGCYFVPGAAVDPRTFNPAKDGEITSSTRAYLAYKIYNSSPADVTVDMDDELDTNMLASFYLSCT